MAGGGLKGNIDSAVKYVSLTRRTMKKSQMKNPESHYRLYALFVVCLVIAVVLLYVDFALYLALMVKVIYYDFFARDVFPRAKIHDVSIAVSNGIHLAKEGNGSLVPVHTMELLGVYPETTRPLVHDPKNDYLYVSGIIQFNATTIYRIDLSTWNTQKLIITDSDVPPNMEGKILGIEYDYIKNVLFWTNGQGGKILKVDLDIRPLQQIVLYDSKKLNLITSGLAVDECSRSLFWTSYIVRDGEGYIESSKLDGADHTTLHHRNLYNPTDITIDHAARKLYWCDMKAGSSFTIERSNLDGSYREELLAGGGVQPSSIALTAKYVYWINIETDKFERIEKNTRKKRQEKILDYEPNKPKSIVSHKVIENCNSYDPAIEIEPFSHNPSPGKQRSSKEQIPNKDVYEIGSGSSTPICLNGGLPDKTHQNTPLEEFKCKCSQNFYGRFCEKCDHCVNGKCILGPNNALSCSCERGYNGSRCEHDICFNYCLNGGTCSIKNQTEPTCNCSTAVRNFQGSRCEIDCSLFCQNNPKLEIYDAGKPVCSCGKNGLYVANMDNSTMDQLASEMSSEQQLRFGLIGMGAIIIFLIAGIIILIIIVVKLRKRPRIKKRIVVNKNVTPTPLTSRPPPVSEQCEITIENCCNMNICETPCYEPQLRTSDRSVSKTEEKKNLLGNMEEGENGSPSRDTLY